MTCMLVGAVINTILDPIFIFVFHMGVCRSSMGYYYREQIASFGIAFRYLWKFKHVTLKIYFKLDRKRCATVGLGNEQQLKLLAITLVQIVLNNSLIDYGARFIYGSETSWKLRYLYEMNVRWQ